MVNSVENLNSLMKRLGYVFKDKQLLQHALTHRSSGTPNNERLEFLGDSVLNFIVAAHLFSHFPDASEGDLTRIRSKWVCESALADIASRFSLDNHLILGQGEKKGGGAHRASILADALEALIGAMYLESGMQMCENIVLSWYRTGKEALWIDAHHKDAKTRLQEYLQAKKLPLPTYTVVATWGDSHHPTFRMACEVSALSLTATGEANSRKKAEQAAAEAILNALGVKINDR
ncbi:MAG: ribonuclease [Pseudomonadota bacterium]